MPKILLVDDYDETLDTLSLIYNLYGEVEIVGFAHNSKELWHILNTKEVDMISLDIQLQHEDGLELCHQIHQKYPNVFIVMCSIETSESNKSKAEKAGASLFLAKPISKDDIRHALQAYQSFKMKTSEKDTLAEEYGIHGSLKSL